MEIDVTQLQTRWIAGKCATRGEMATEILVDPSSLAVARTLTCEHGCSLKIELFRELGGLVLYKLNYITLANLVSR